MFLGARDGHVEQTALFFEFALGIGTQGGREDILFESYNKDRGELQTLGRMDGHKRHLAALFAVAVAIEIGQQGYFLKIVTERNFVLTAFLLATLHEVLESGKELFKILLASHGLG